MTSNVADEGVDIIENNRNLNIHTSGTTFSKNSSHQDRSNLLSLSESESYTMAYDNSHFSRDVDRWLNGSNVIDDLTVAETTLVNAQARVPMVQRSVMAQRSCLDLWYMLVMLLPLFTVNSPQWNCASRTIIATAELFVNQVSLVCSRIRAHVRRLAEDNFARNLIATAMDILLVIYAIGFLVLSLYQYSLVF